MRKCCTAFSKNLPGVTWVPSNCGSPYNTPSIWTCSTSCDIRLHVGKTKNAEDSIYTIIFESIAVLEIWHYQEWFFTPNIPTKELFGIKLVNNRQNALCWQGAYEEYSDVEFWTMPDDYCYAVFFVSKLDSNLA